MQEQQLRDEIAALQSEIAGMRNELNRAQWLRNDVKKMRDLQKSFFKTKSPHTLEEAKDAERRVDKAIEDAERANSAPPQLFT